MASSSTTTTITTSPKAALVQQQQKQSTKALTHYLSSFDFLSHINSHPDPHHLHLMLWELKDPLWTIRLRRRGLPLALLCYSILPGLGVSIFTNIYCCLFNPHYHYILYLFFNATQRRWQTKWRGCSLVPPVDNGENYLQYLLFIMIYNNRPAPTILTRLFFKGESNVESVFSNKYFFF